MATQEREIVDLLWDNDRADALDKLKDMLQVKAAAAVDTSKLDIANRMFPHVPDDGKPTGLPPEGEASPDETADVINRNPDENETKENDDETDNGTEQ
mgnify:FL=1|jgi:hypothetical protein|tara:strand:+ start:1254 stop:1547 length:294 start_codon:yes stop_codon:yes gene_type:complete